MTALPYLLAGLNWMAAPSAAAESGRFAVPVAASGAGSTIGGGALNVAFSLALVVGAIVLLGWLARRLRSASRTRTGVLRVIDEVTLGAKERVVVLEVDGARLVIGVGDGRIAVLHRPEARPVAGTAMDVDASGARTGDARLQTRRFDEIIQRAEGK